MIGFIGFNPMWADDPTQPENITLTQVGPSSWWVERNLCAPLLKTILTQYNTSVTDIANLINLKYMWLLV